MPTSEAATAARFAYLRMRRSLLEIDNVIGVGFGAIEEDGIATDRLGVVVLTLRPDDGTAVRVRLLLEGIPFSVRPARLSRKDYLAYLHRNHIPVERAECNPDGFLFSHVKFHQLNMRRLDAGDAIGAVTLPGGPLSGLRTAVIGDIFVVEDDGRLVLGNGIDHVAAYKLFRTQFGDDYDFLLFHYDKSPGLPVPQDSSTIIYSKVKGIRHYRGDACDDRGGWGSARLQSIQMIPTLELRRMLHEVGHLWCAYVQHSEGGAASDKLHQDQADSSQPLLHWGDWFDNGNSCLDYDYFDWVDSTTVPGEFQVAKLKKGAPGVDVFGYHPLDLYLMGLVGPEEVGPFRYIDNPTDDDGDGSYAGVAVELGIDNVLAEEGQRDPAYPDTQRVFHHASILFTRNLAGVGDIADPSSALGKLDLYRRSFVEAFRRETRSRAMIDASLLQPNFQAIHIRDNDADGGVGASAGNFWNSPDIWIRNSDDGGTEHQDTLRGQDNFLHARVRNGSGQPYDKVIVRFYATADLGMEYYYPEDWRADLFIGEARVDVPAGGEAIAKIIWPAARIPKSGRHPTLLVELIPMEVMPDHRHLACENRKLALKNVMIVPDDSATFEVPFDCGHPVTDGNAPAILTVTRAEEIVGLELLLAGGLDLGFGDGAAGTVEIDGKSYYRLPNVSSVAVNVPQVAGKRTPLILRGELADDAGAAAGLIQVTQTDPAGRIVGGFDLRIGG